MSALTPACSLLAAMMMMVFAVASRELVATLLLAPTGVKTTSLYIWRQFEQGSVGKGMAMSVLTILVTTGVMLAVTLWRQRGVGGGVSRALTCSKRGQCRQTDKCRLTDVRLLELVSECRH